MKFTMISFGNFLFKQRNVVFPLVIAAAYLAYAPPDKMLGSELIEQWKDFVAVLVATSGILLRIAVLSYTRVPRSGADRHVHANALFTEGFYAGCRNPLYVGNMLIYIGVFSTHGDWRVVIGGILLFWFFYQSIIYAEEAYLTRRFDEAYSTYCRRVPRWGLDLRALSTSLRAGRFHLKQGLLTDYHPATNAIATLAATEMYETMYFEGGMQHWLELLALGSIILLAFIVRGALRHMKKQLKASAADASA